MTTSMSRRIFALLIVTAISGAAIIVGITWQRDIAEKKGQATQQHIHILENQIDDLQAEIRRLKHELVILKQLSPSDAKEKIATRAREILPILKGRNYESLSSFISPDKGLTFRPFVLGGALQFSAVEVREFATDSKKYNWGIDPDVERYFVMTPTEYFAEFVYERDFVNATNVAYMKEYTGLGAIAARSLVSMYPEGIIVWFYFPNTKEGFGKGLGLVFEKQDDTWYLVALAHDEWSM